MRAQPPTDAAPYVRIRHAGNQYAVWFHAGRPAWIAFIWAGHGIGVVERVDTLSARSPLADAARAATAFLDTLRFPAVAA